MGCDIHFVIEKKLEGQWVGVYATYITPNMQTQDNPVFKDCAEVFMTTFNRYPVFKARDYDFFARLAGVRGEGPEPLGVPEDVSQLARIMIDQDGADGHSHSWLDYDKFCGAYAIGTAEIFDVQAMAYLTGQPDDNEGKAPYRVVFWFDN
jgi:hypothetical protein